MNLGEVAALVGGGWAIGIVAMLLGLTRADRIPTPRGPQGFEGICGETGPPGPPGADGADGIDGMDAQCQCEGCLERPD